MGVPTQKIFYIPGALDAIINDMVMGKAIRMVGSKKVYYGIGDSGDKLLAQTAIERGYDTLQFLREAQMSLKGDAVVGNELIHLIEPIYSQAYLVRLDPFDRPYIQSEDPMKTMVNYLLDTSIQPISVKVLQEKEYVFDPYEDGNMVNVISNR
jgi:hypothetical protein